ncbi:MAG: hypothetical protein KME64_17720 [Scytonematopsis contorta HA4267-MV1]|jgi:hypothetical protein|nr:hypothetical protein [Scytonematopsis contorta HA4267-MV1]
MQKFIKLKVVRRVFVVLHWGLAIQPALFFVGLVGMSERAAQLLGKFPKPSINDPYLFGQNDLTYQNWIRFANIFCQLTFICLIPWFCLTALTLLFHWRYWSKEESNAIALYRFLPISIYILSFLIILFEPTNRFGWFLD